jgi:hypothetical protein
MLHDEQKKPHCSGATITVAASGNPANLENNNIEGNDMNATT